MLQKPDEKTFTKTMSIELMDEEKNVKYFIFLDFVCTQDNLVQCRNRFHPDPFGNC